MSNFTDVPIKFPSMTMFNPKLVMTHVDDLKRICQELQTEIIKLREKIDSLEKSTSKKPKE